MSRRNKIIFYKSKGQENHQNKEGTWPCEVFQSPGMRWGLDLTVPEAQQKGWVLKEMGIKTSPLSIISKDYTVPECVV